MNKTLSKVVYLVQSVFADFRYARIHVVKPTVMGIIKSMSGLNKLSFISLNTSHCGQTNPRNVVPK